MKRHNAEITVRIMYVECSCCGGSCTVHAKIDREWKKVSCSTCLGFGQMVINLDDDKRKGAA